MKTYEISETLQKTVRESKKCKTREGKQNGETKKDKEKIRPLYQRYHDIKLNLETLKSEIESVGDSQMIQALIDVNATSNGSDENRFLSKNEIGKLGSTFRRSGNGNGEWKFSWRSC